MFNELSQRLQSVKGDPWGGFIPNGIASQRIEHPGGNRDLEPILETDHSTGLNLPTQDANDLYFLIEKGMVSIEDSAELRLTGSVLTRRVTRLQFICWSRAPISATSRSCSAIGAFRAP